MAPPTAPPTAPETAPFASTFAYCLTVSHHPFVLIFYITCFLKNIKPKMLKTTY